jgi:tetratricopeptide (TPR) repeat protein
MSNRHHNNPWALILSGDFQNGISLLERDLHNLNDASSTKEIGIAYLWARRYSTASEHFKRAIKSGDGISDYYVFLGVAEWCDGRKAEAKLAWHAGRRASYGDTAGLNIEPLLFEYFGEEFTRNGNIDEITRQLRLKAADVRSSTSWPGPVARYLAGVDSSTQAKNFSPPSDDTQYRRLRHWTVAFYENLKKPARNTTESLQHDMKHLVAEAEVQLKNIDCFIEYIWRGEFFLARSFIE